MMTKRNFEDLAKAINGSLIVDSRLDLRQCRKQHQFVAESVATVCAECNPEFDEAKFMKACGVQYED